jgi:predicted metalloprotease
MYIDWRFFKSLKSGMGPSNELWSSHLLHSIHNVGHIWKWKLGEFDQMNQQLLNFCILYQSSSFNYRIPTQLQH